MESNHNNCLEGKKKEKMINPNEVFQRIRDLAEFARSVLHLPFPDLDKVNPSFSVIAKTCELIAIILEEEAHAGTEYAKDLASTMNDIAVAIMDRDDCSIIDCMAILDEFIENQRKLKLVK
ncbi:hypothetical protein [Vibrio cholerae]|uniref:hypothetical protein n=1 Tax=Vibrio cholerae TaxID=666 RepID=UPI000E0A05C3|nr:hypothetical protein [Vibrio cholerae]RNE82583.1 hypothetical protein EEJ35_08255 [Vibrio cholerae]